eukprot:RCo004345
MRGKKRERESCPDRHPIYKIRGLILPSWRKYCSWRERMTTESGSGRHHFMASLGPPCSEVPPDEGHHASPSPQRREHARPQQRLVLLVLAVRVQVAPEVVEEHREANVQQDPRTHGVEDPLHHSVDLPAEVHAAVQRHPNGRTHRRRNGEHHGKDQLVPMGRQAGVRDPRPQRHPLEELVEAQRHQKTPQLVVPHHAHRKPHEHAVHRHPELQHVRLHHLLLALLGLLHVQHHDGVAVPHLPGAVAAAVAVAHFYRAGLVETAHQVVQEVHHNAGQHSEEVGVGGVVRQHLREAGRVGQRLRRGLQHVHQRTGQDDPNAHTLAQHDDERMNF